MYFVGVLAPSLHFSSGSNKSTCLLVRDLPRATRFSRLDGRDWRRRGRRRVANSKNDGGSGRIGPLSPFLLRQHQVPRLTRFSMVEGGREENGGEERHGKREKKGLGWEDWRRRGRRREGSN